MILKSENFIDSPFNDTEYSSEDGMQLAYYKPQYLIKGTTYKLYTVKDDSETLQSIAAKFYGDSGKWYIIADVNKICNPFKEVYPGLILKIP